MVGIYKIENLVNGKVYIGQSKDINIRFEQHKNRLFQNVHENIYLQRSYNKYGSENFKFEVLEECKEESLTEREQYWIDYYGGINSDNTYNSKSAKDSVMFNDDVRKRMSITHKQNPNRYWLSKKRSDETVEKMRNTLIENNKHRTISDETRLKLSIAGKQRKGNISEETKQKISQAHKGWIPSEETRQRMSRVAKNKPKKPRTKEHCDNISKALTGIKRCPMSEERKQYLSNKLKGRKREDWEKQKISESLKNKPLSQAHKQALKEGWKKRKANGKGTPWNKGLTKETDERVAKISNSLQNYFNNKDKEK